MLRKDLYNAKGYWKRRFKQLDQSVLRLMNLERSGAIEIPIMDYVVKGHETVQIGLTGEEILAKIVQLGMNASIVIDMRNMVNMVEVLSVRLKQVAESKWQGELSNFPVFKSNTATVGDLLEKTKAIQEMNKLLEE